MEDKSWGKDPRNKIMENSEKRSERRGLKHWKYTKYLYGEYLHGELRHYLPDSIREFIKEIEVVTEDEIEEMEREMELGVENDPAEELDKALIPRTFYKLMHIFGYPNRCYDYKCFLYYLFRYKGHLIEVSDWKGLLESDT